MILITGGQGQLGTELRYLLDEKAVEYVAAGLISWMLPIE